MGYTKFDANTIVTYTVTGGTYYRHKLQMKQEHFPSRGNVQ